MVKICLRVTYVLNMKNFLDQEYNLLLIFNQYSSSEDIILQSFVFMFGSRRGMKLAPMVDTSRRPEISCGFHRVYQICEPLVRHAKMAIGY